MGKAKSRIRIQRGGARRARIYEGDARTAVIARTAAVLNEATLSKFEFEGLCRHSLRERLCLAGHRWEPADLEAAAIVSAALGAIGAVRPSWAMGQPQITIPQEDCQRCGGAIDDEDRAAGRRYCSDTCAASSRIFAREFYDRVTKIAHQKLTARATETKACLQCGSEFSPFKRGHGQDYCSLTCARRARGDLKPERPCEHCGKGFVPPHADSRFCSTPCKIAGIAAEQPIRPCQCCGTEFQPTTAHGKYCSPRCRRLGWAREKRANEADAI